jgi:hypothetical protein
MKKITFGLMAFLAAQPMLQAQVNTQVQAPPYDLSWSTLHAPMGTQLWHRGCYLVKQSELTGLALTNSVITKVGFDVLASAGVAATGQMTLYLQNTTDATYSKGFNFPTCLVGMQNSYSGSFPLPAASANTTTIWNTLTNTLPYSGGGLYVAWEFSLTAVAGNTVQYMTNTSGLTTGGGYTVSSVSPPPNTIQTHSSSAAFRPCFRFEAANTATNELEIIRMTAPGKMSKLFSTGHVITAVVRNNSAQTLTNIPVSLTVAGANPFTDIATVNSLGAGLTTTVSFLPYLPTNTGLSTMTVTVPPDQLPANDDATWAQTVTCVDFASIPPLPATSFTSPAYGWNPTVGGIYSYKMRPPSNCSLTAMQMAQATGTMNGSMYGVLMDASGVILATSQTVALTNVSSITFIDFKFNPPVSITGGTDYLFGVAQPPYTGSQYFPFANIAVTPTVTNFYLSAITGGAPTNAHRGYIAIGALLSFPSTTISVAQTKTVVCKADRAPLTLTATGAQSYAWSIPGAGTGSTAVVTPTIQNSQSQGIVQYSVSGTFTTGPAAGCKSADAVVQFSVAPCLGMNDLDNYADIQLFPNPVSNGKLTVNGLQGKNTIVVMNTLGQTVITSVTDAETTDLDMSALANGNYLVRITDDANRVKSVKVSKQ